MSLHNPSVRHRPPVAFTTSLPGGKRDLASLRPLLTLSVCLHVCSFVHSDWSGNPLFCQHSQMNGSVCIHKDWSSLKFSIILYISLKKTLNFSYYLLLPLIIIIGWMVFLILWNVFSYLDTQILSICLQSCPYHAPLSGSVWPIHFGNGFLYHVSISQLT